MTETSNKNEKEPLPKRIFKSYLDKLRFFVNLLNTFNNGPYWFTRVVFLRSLAFIYFVAFLVALNQNTGLLGNNGLLPIDVFMKNVENNYGKLSWKTFLQMPTLFWFVDKKDATFYMQAFSTLGLSISLCIILTGAANMIAMFTLWILYHSIINVGQTWYSFGWESQLLETGFLGMFLCPLFTWKKYPENTPPSTIVIWGLRWLLFRIMIGAGMIKIRNDPCWRDLTCMNYHYQTQPVPNPLSYYLHQSPEIIHKMETLGNHVVELILPWFTFLPRPFKLICGISQILFQFILILSGNLSFLNWLTILPAIAYFDDRSLQCLFTKKQQDIQSNLHSKQSKNQLKSSKLRNIANITYGLVLIHLSIPVVINLFSRHQVMNTSYDPLRLVNTYGAFGTITRERTEIILKGTSSSMPDNAIWEEYEFNCKPGNVTRRPCIISPYHYRLDWLMWFAAFQNWQHNPWLVHLMGELMVNSPEATDLIAHNPFRNKDPPKWIKADHYVYTYTKWNSQAAKDGAWWKRKFRQSYFGPVNHGMLKQIYQHFGWKIPKK
ncbi:LMF1 [Cordylochernes scorpioides]|uniref:Lipase maturation factor n=1 Tax=Cordylochernes scorpioides TaxID=51811 RepID=A0ABY6LTT4_9ARAC|nr:LMF1 [Cordylochernes scorpioides]